MKRILLVDDEPANLELLKEILREHAAEICTANSGEKALELAESLEIDVVISDLMMPGIKGTDLFLKLRRKYPFLQAVIVTAYPSFDDIVKMLESGASDFVIKPIDAEQFIKVIEHAFAKVDRLRQLRKDWLEYRRRSK